MTQAVEKSTTEHKIPIDARGPVTTGVLIVLLAIGGFTGWAVTAPLAEAVVTSGVIKVDSSRKLLQHLEGGIVKEIRVRDGDRVRQGEILIRLDKTNAAASLAILHDRLNLASAQEARLIAERDNKKGITFPSQLLAQRDKSKVESLIKAQTELFIARGSSLTGQINILEKQITHLRKNIIGLNAQKAAKTHQLEFVRDELESMRHLLKKGLTGKQRVLELEREMARLEGDRGELQSEIAATDAAISSKELEIHQVKKGFHENVANELEQVQSEILDFRERLNAAQHTLGQTEVRSPVDGIVVSSNVHTIGGVVSPGETLLEIVPENDKLIVEARIEPRDIDNLSPGLPAGVKITAFKQRKSPELAGTLRYLSADIMQDPQTGQAYFIARLEVDEAEVRRLGDKQLQPGMMAEVFIRTGERTPADYLLQPLRDSFQRAWLEE